MINNSIFLFSEFVFTSKGKLIDIIYQTEKIDRQIDKTNREKFSGNCEIWNCA